MVHFASSIAAMQDTAMKGLNAIPKEDFSGAMRKLEKSANKCVECYRNYFE